MDCFIQGGTPGVTHDAGLPNITGTFGNGESEYHRLQIYNSSGCFTNAGSSTIYAHDIDGGWYGGRPDGIKLDASLSSSIYGSSTTVQPKSIEINWCIKY